ncbi:hypothetical protein COLSTE_01384 [Collinsella stercoris DSM 13279]|uniref:Uncharacterized protein n=1 Tax=Collinsella stercoris DSM 13279 TaxID=445975 RepID=B6GBC5_9ACTN|nr:hypothetical protein COLSTE_01384 [Collinsella stercoris DSM 13279]
MRNDLDVGCGIDVRRHQCEMFLIRQALNASWARGGCAKDAIYL